MCAPPERRTCRCYYAAATMPPPPRPPLPFEDIVVGARFFWNLPRFLRSPLSVEQAAAILRRRLAQRETDFLALIGRAVFRRPDHPYRQLLDLAGCEAGDLERLVRQEGVEGALGALYRNGVYLTVDELKGRQAAVRGSGRVEVDPAR